MNQVLSMLFVLIFLALVIGLLFWGLNQIPMSQPARVIITVLIGIGALMVLLRMFGLWGIWP